MWGRLVPTGRGRTLPSVLMSDVCPQAVSVEGPVNYFLRKHCMIYIIFYLSHTEQMWCQDVHLMLCHHKNGRWVGAKTAGLYLGHFRVAQHHTPTGGATVPLRCPKIHHGHPNKIIFWVNFLSSSCIQITLTTSQWVGTTTTGTPLFTTGTQLITTETPLVATGLNSPHCLPRLGSPVGKISWIPLLYWITLGNTPGETY
jgi:hypothetical protein